METKQHRQYSNIVEFIEDEKTLFNVSNQRMTDAEFKKQIALMESAQDMLEALEGIMLWTAHFPQLMNDDILKANAAIKAAKGDAKC